MNLLIAADSFKDALDAPAVCEAIARGLLRANPDFQVRTFPLSDGGEGMMEVLRQHLGLHPVTVEVRDPLFRRIPAQYSVSRDGSIAFIEMAQAAGLPLLQPAERNPLHTTTFGVGEMLAHALTHGAQQIVLGIGGSATNDLGTGMAAALGWQFLDDAQQSFVPTGGTLSKIRQVIPPAEPLKASMEVICDVKNPLLGASGAAQTYARQKGASDNDIILLETGGHDFISRFAAGTDLATTAGAGAAGGMGFGSMFFLKGVLKPGIEAMMDLTGFEAQLVWADMVFTGEGRIDHQTAQGKLIAGIVSRAHPKPVIALCGALTATPAEVQALGLKAAFAIAQRPCTLTEALADTAMNLEVTAEQVGSVLMV